MVSVIAESFLQLLGKENNIKVTMINPQTVNQKPLDVLGEIELQFMFGPASNKNDSFTCGTIMIEEDGDYRKTSIIPYIDEETTIYSVTLNNRDNYKQHTGIFLVSRCVPFNILIGMNIMSNLKGFIINPKKSSSNITRNTNSISKISRVYCYRTM
jgi:hypothetical protein